MVNNQPELFCGICLEKVVRPIEEIMYELKNKGV